MDEWEVFWTYEGNVFSRTGLSLDAAYCRVDDLREDGVTDISVFRIVDHDS